jgi:hypothetical protein
MANCYNEVQRAILSGTPTAKVAARERGSLGPEEDTDAEMRRVNAQITLDLDEIVEIECKSHARCG